ncbi:MAG: extracellular solute-binding protein, partial [Gemmatimonadales bacterium]
MHRGIGRGGCLLVVLGMLLALAGCGGDSRELVVYSGRSRELIEPLLTQIHEDTGIQVAVKYGDTRELALLLSEEGERSPADVFISQAPGATGFLLEQGLLAPIDAQQLQTVPERFRGPGGEWVGLSGRLRVLVYNQDMVAEAELPGSVLDLTAPQYAGKVAIAPTNASFQDFVTAMRQIHGDEETAAWLRAMAAADSPAYANNNAIVEA